MNQLRAPSIVSKVRPLSQYLWGNKCEAWNLVNNNDVSVKLERMPAGAEEELHYHKQAQQFFFIIKGTAVFEVDEVILIVHEAEGLHIEAGRHHRLMNKEEEQPLEFVIFSHPSSANDRYNLV